MSAVFLLTNLYSFAQDFSNKGRDFWVGYGYHQVMTTNNGQEMVLYFATEAATNVTVSIPGLGYSKTYSIAANTVATSELLPKVGALDARLLSESSGPENKGIHITSDQPIVAYAHIYNMSVSGATILFPTNTLGREYYSINFQNRANTVNANAWTYVIAADTGTTTVEIIPSQPTLNRPAGVPFTVQLTQGQVYNIMGQFTNAASGSNHSGVDLTGTFIRSINTGSGCKKIAVFSGSGRISITCPGNTTSSSSDNYMVQAFPKNAWGKKYLTATASNPQSFNLYRVCVSTAATVVRVNGVALSPATLVGGFYYDLPITNQPMSIEADNPITVAQYFTSQGSCGNGSPGDPEVIYLSPVEQNINKVSWNATGNFAILQHYINVVIPNKGTAISSLRIRDGAGNVVPTGTFTIHPGDANYSYIKQSLPGSGVYTISSDSGFNAIAYGFGNAESYGYNAGTNVIDLYQYVTTQNANATIKSPVTCKSSPFLMSLTLPYLPISMKWDLTGYPDVIDNAPVADSSFVLNGKTLYVFKLPGNFIYNTAGKYPVIVTVNNPTPDGCLGEQIINFDLEVLDPPVATFSWANNPAAGCTDSLISFSGINTSGGRPIVRHFWDFGDGTTAAAFNPAKAFGTPGQFNVRYLAMTDAGCLSDTIVKMIEVTKAPVAKFGILDPLCVGKTLTFSDSSSLPGGYGSIVNWNWNTGIGIPVNNPTGANVTATYASTGNYSTSLQLRSNTGCLSPVYSLPVTIRPNPVVDFTASFGCMPNPVINFNSTSTIADGTQSQFLYLWNFGDPGSGGSNISTIQNPSHQYPGVGSYNAKLKITSAYGCADSTTKIVDKIYPQPKADFTAPTEVCWQTPITFTNASNGFTHPVTKWEWRFSDGTSSIQQNPVKNFTNPGTYTATLWVFTDQNCVSDTVVKTVVVNPWPAANFTTSAIVCEKNALTLTNTSTANAGSIVRSYWDVDDNSTYNSAGLTATHTYSNWGDYTIRFVTETDKGCRSDTLIRTVRINPLPKPGFILPEVCLSDAQALFTDTSSIADNSEAQMSYLWKFNTGIPAVSPGPTPVTSTAKNPSIKFNKAADYLLSLEVTSKDGCRDSVTAIPFTVNGSIPVADFAVRSAANLCSNQDVELEDKSTVDFGNVTRVEIYWDNANAPTVFETDDEPAAGKIYKHKYPDFQSPLTKTYQVRYKSYSGILCVDEIIKTITINASPATVFNAMVGVCINDAPFQLSQAAEMGGLNGVGVYTGPGVGPTYLFNPANAGAGIHNILYTFTAANGCVSTSNQSIEVWPKPTVNAGPDLTVLEDGVRKITGVTTSGNGLQFLWTPSTYLDDATLQFPTILQPKDDITYKLTVTNDQGCSETDELYVKILKSPRPPNTFTPNGDGINDFWEIQFLNDYPGAIIEVYNTAGTLLFRSVGYSTPWDGKWKGQPVPAGTYYYVLDPKNGRKRIAGYVTILR
ncbi:gliding motility-associated C-terminal domain-containing protein [Lacibacter sp. H407]|uniref:gliding motility-associated C-terminal domain-containing protein n=1 Tax=Lacibacter sp. H407 TaxID=3133423 RepID=UPI0030BDF59C